MIFSNRLRAEKNERYILGDAMYDVCIIGGGASGMACAIAAAGMGLKCIIIEKEAKLGRKIYASGNGRCNITNHNFDRAYSKYYNSSFSDYEGFLKRLFIKSSPDKEITDFLFSLGMPTYDIGSYVYPYSLQASSLMWTLTDKIKELKIDALHKTCVEKIDYIDEAYVIKTKKNDIIHASNVVLACGGAGYESLGGSKKGYELAKALDINCTDIRPSLCGLITKDDISILSGVRIRARAFLYDDSKKNNAFKTMYACEEGELQFTDYGISGIMIFNLSGKAGSLISSQKRAYISLDLLPDIKDEIIFDVFKKSNYRRPKAVLNNFLNDKLAGYIVDNIEKDIKASCNDIKYDEQYVKKITEALHSFNIEIKALKDFDNAQVTAGGICLDIINPKDMSITNKNGLYAVGELTDIDGICGGYNLTYAFISGIRAGKGIYDKIKSDKNQRKKTEY